MKLVPRRLDGLIRHLRPASDISMTSFMKEKSDLDTSQKTKQHAKRLDIDKNLINNSNEMTELR